MEVGGESGSFCDTGLASGGGILALEQKVGDACVSLALQTIIGLTLESDSKQWRAFQEHSREIVRICQSVTISATSHARSVTHRGGANWGEASHAFDSRGDCLRVDVKVVNSSQADAINRTVRRRIVRGRRRQGRFQTRPDQ